MDTMSKKPTSKWTRLTVLGALLIALCLAYETIWNGGHLLPIWLTTGKSYTVKITGTSGLRFCGTISIKTYNGTTQHHMVDEEVPQTFEIFGKSVSVTFGKCEEEGNLKVAIAEDGHTAVEKTTADAYGTISLGLN